MLRFGNLEHCFRKPSYTSEPEKFKWDNFIKNGTAVQAKKTDTEGYNVPNRKIAGKMLFVFRVANHIKNIYSKYCCNSMLPLLLQQVHSVKLRYYGCIRSHSSSFNIHIRLYFFLNGCANFVDPYFSFINRSTDHLERLLRMVNFESGLFALLNAGKPVDNFHQVQT